MAVALDADPTSTTDQRVDAGGPLPERIARSSLATCPRPVSPRRWTDRLVKRSSWIGSKGVPGGVLDAPIYNTGGIRGAIFRHIC